MKKKCKAYTQSKCFNDRIKDTQNLTTNIPSREDIVLTYSHCSTRDERLEHSICKMN